jgi:NTE family protein
MQQNSVCVTDVARSAFGDPVARISERIHQLALAVARRTKPRRKPPRREPPHTEPPRPGPRHSQPRRERQFALALQGGGALGAFTWGVLDRLLEVPGFSPHAISGASAGAANAVVMASGWMTGGCDGAKESLDHFWHRIGMLPTLYRRLPSAFGFDATFAFEMASAIVSPYDFNPLNHNPLRPIIGELADFERLQSAEAPPLFISATDVETGRARIFSNPELTLDVVLASACLPHLFQAVQIDGRAYWDGGYTSNPPIDPLRPFLDEARLMLVLVNPQARAGLPRTAREIAARLGEVIGNASVWRELEGLAGYDAIELPEQPGPASAADKYNNDWRFIQKLRDQGRAAAEDWLAADQLPATVPA